MMAFLNMFGVRILAVGLVLALGYIGYLSLSNAGLQYDLERKQAQIELLQGAVIRQAATIAAQQDQVETEQHLRRVAEHAIREIHDSPNASTPVPPDIAAAWAAGIDGLRDAAAAPGTNGDSGGFAELPTA